MGEHAGAADLKQRLIVELRGMLLDGPPSATGSLARFGRRSPTGGFGPLDDPAVMEEAGFRFGARVFHEAGTPVDDAGLPLSDGFGFAISGAAVVASAEAAARAAHHLFPSLRDPSRPPPAGSTRGPIDVGALPNAFGVRGHNASGTSTQISFSHGEAVYWLTTLEKGLPDPPSAPTSCSR